MTITSIPDNDRKERFIATAGQTIFPFDFPIYDAADLQVKRERAGVESTLIFGTDYTLTGAGEQAGGNITLTAGAQLNDIIVLLSAMPSGRTAQYVNGGDLPASALEGDFNRIRILLQQILRDARAGLLYPQTDGPMPDLPPIVSRAGRFLAFDAQGQPYAAGAPGTALDAIARAGDTMTGPLRITGGSSAAPGLTPAGDTNTGFFAPAPDEIAIAAGGQEVARWNATGQAPRAWLNVASAATVNLGNQNADSLRITGTNTIDSFGTAASGARRRLRIATGLTITHNPSNIICPGAVNLVLLAGDVLDVESLGAGVWVVVDLQPAAGYVAPGLITGAGLTIETASVLGRVAAGSGAIQRIPLANPAAAVSLGISRGTAQATTSGASLDFTGIPAGVREITLLLRGVSMSGSERFLIQIGAGSIVTTGYSSSSSGPDNSGFWVNSTSTSGFLLGTSIDAVNTHSGHLTLHNISGDIWVANGSISNNATGAGGRGAIASGQLTLSGALDRLRLTNTGSNTFDGGEANILWRF